MTSVTQAKGLERFFEALREVDPVRATGVVEQIVGLLIESKGPPAGIADFCEIRTRAGHTIRTQVIGFREGRILSMPLEETEMQPGDTLVTRRRDSRVAVSSQLLGRVIDGFGIPMDGGAPIRAEAFYDLYAAPPGPLEREPICAPSPLGSRLLTGF